MASDRQYFSMVLFTLYKVIVTYKPVDKFQSVTIQMKAPEQYFPVVSLITPHEMVLS